MGKGNGSSRSTRGRAEASNNISSVGTSFTNVANIPTYDAKQTKEALDKATETVRAIVNGGGQAGEGWNVLNQLTNRNTAFEMLGRSRNTPEAKEVINNLKIDRLSASLTNEGDVITDGTSVYVVQKVNKNGSVRAEYTSYERVPSRGFSTGYKMKPIAERRTINKNEIVTRFGNGGSARRYFEIYESNVRKAREGK